MTTVTLQKGSHHLTEPLILEGVEDFTYDLSKVCWYRERLARTKNIEMVTLRDCYNVRLLRPTIFGSKPYRQGFRNRSEGEHGIGLHGCSNITIIEPTIHNVCGDFVYLGPRGQTICKDVRIERPDFFNSGRHGIAALTINGLHVEAGRILGYRNSAVDKERQFGKRSIAVNMHVSRKETEIVGWRKLSKLGRV
jgi:hypothetical protein